VTLAPRIGWIPCTATTLMVTPRVGMAAHGVVRGRQANTSVSRASII
jgi:hypothetical protein